MDVEGLAKLPGSKIWLSYGTGPPISSGLPRPDLHPSSLEPGCSLWQKLPASQHLLPALPYHVDVSQLPSLSPGLLDLQTSMFPLLLSLTDPQRSMTVTVATSPSPVSWLLFLQSLFIAIDF